MNGLLKVPMQFFILFIGVMVFVFYQLSPPPLFFNRGTLETVRERSGAEVARLEAAYGAAFAEKRAAIERMLAPSAAPAEAASARAEVRVQEARMEAAPEGLRGARGPDRSRAPTGRTPTSSSCASCSTTSPGGSWGSSWR